MHDRGLFRSNGGSIVRSLKSPILVLAACLSFAACGGSGSQDGSGTSASDSDFSPPIAEVGGQPISMAYFDYRYENLAPMDKSRYSGEGWEQRFLDYLIDESLVVQAAEAEKLALVRETGWRLQMARQSVLYRAYHLKHFGESVVVPEEEILAVYEADPEVYRNRGRMTAQHIQCSTKEKIDQAWAELQDGEHWSRVCMAYTEDSSTIDAGGSLGWFNPDGYVIGLGFNKEFTDVAFTIEERTLAPPVRIGENWHIIRTGAKIPGEIQPLEEVRERIARGLRPGIAREEFERQLRVLKSESSVRYFGEFAEKDRRSAEALYRVAAETRDPHAKVDFYGKVVDMYPDHDLADESLFMQGFVYSEEFGDVASAAMCFRRLRREYVDSEYLDEADWMLKNLGRAVPELREEGLPRTAEEADARIKELGN
jgi:hypothetical protein